MLATYTYETMRPPIVDGLVTKVHDQATYSYCNHCFRYCPEDTEKLLTLAYYTQYEMDGHSVRKLLYTIRDGWPQWKEVTIHNTRWMAAVEGSYLIQAFLIHFSSCTLLFWISNHLIKGSTPDMFVVHLPNNLGLMLRKEMH